MAIFLGRRFEPALYNPDYRYECTLCGTKAYTGTRMTVLRDPTTHKDHIFCPDCVNSAKQKIRDAIERAARFEEGEHCYHCFHGLNLLTPAPFFNGEGPGMLCHGHYREQREQEPGKPNQRRATDNNLTPNSNKEEHEKMNMSNLFGGAKIGKVESDQFKLSMMGLAIKVGSGQYACYDGSAMVNVMDFIMDAEGMIYQLPVQVVSKGDLIIAKGKPVYVVDTQLNGQIEIFDPTTDFKETYIPQKNLFGFQFFVKVVSLFNMMQPQGQASNPMMQMLPFLFLGEKNGDSGDMMKMFAMSQFMNPQAQNNPMASFLPFMFLGKGENGDMVKMMLMSQMMGGQNSFSFPFMQPTNVKTEEAKQGAWPASEPHQPGGQPSNSENPGF